MKKMIISCILPVFICCLGNSVFAASSKQNDEAIDKIVTVHNETADDDEKLVCKREKVTGTRFAKKICKTRKQIRKEKKRKERELA